MYIYVYLFSELDKYNICCTGYGVHTGKPEPEGAVKVLIHRPSMHEYKPHKPGTDDKILVINCARWRVHIAYPYVSVLLMCIVPYTRRTIFTTNCDQTSSLFIGVSYLISFVMGWRGAGDMII